MANKTKKTTLDYVKSMKDALMKFDLVFLKKWLKKYRGDLYLAFEKADETVQMATMCKMIINRTDMLNTEACKKARLWLKENNMKGRLF